MLNFVRADYRTAIGQFTEARALAEAAGRSEISGTARLALAKGLSQWLLMAPCFHHLCIHSIAPVS